MWLELDFRAVKFFVLPSTRFEPTPLIHCSTIRLKIILVSCHHHTHNYIMTAERVVQTYSFNSKSGYQKNLIVQYV